MWAVYLLVSLIYSGNCLQIQLSDSSHSEELTKCVTDIIKKYFVEAKEVTYVGNRGRDEAILKTINNANIVSMVSNTATGKLLILNQAYFISANNFTSFVTHFSNVIKESSWNPRARLLLLLGNIKESELRNVFDIFLKVHANNVLVVNGSADAHLYTYNPFDNYNCGKRYDTTIRFGKCSQARSHNLYPEKLVTGLKNCSFNVQMTHWPPYTILSFNKSSSSPSELQNGVEPYLLRVMGEKLGFSINIIDNYGDADEFSTVTNDMQVVGALKKIQDNEVDMHISAMLLTPARAAVFSYVYGHLVYTDEIRFVVRRARNVPPWKNTYLEFDFTVWLLLLLAFVIYSVLVIVILRTEDKSYVMLILVDNLVLHGRTVQSRWPVKCVLMFWVVFAYLVNSFYQSSLFSLTTNPAQEYQICKEEDIAHFQLKPCLSTIMGVYYTESIQSNAEFDGSDMCYRLLESVEAVAKSENLYTLLLDGVYRYHEQAFFDEFGYPRVISLPKPYSKVIYAMYLYKGFPLIDELCYISIQLRENGLVDKVMRDMIYIKKIKHRFHQNEFGARLAVPWVIYIFGCTVSVLAFIIELISQRYQHYS